LAGQSLLRRQQRSAPFTGVKEPSHALATGKHAAYWPDGRARRSLGDLSAVAQRAKAEAGANHFGFTEVVSSPKIKNISLYPKGKSVHNFGHPVLLRGALAIVANVGRVAVDADVATDERDKGVR
jgi:hypothetical protein